MGISSYTCAKTNLPIIVIGSSLVDGKDLNKVLLFPGPGEEPILGTLGQYQTFQYRDGTFDLLESGIARKIEKGEAKFALRDFLEPGDHFGTLGRSHSDPGQGGLTYEDRFLSRAVKAGGFKSFLGLELAHSADVPLKIALDIDEDAGRRYHAFVKEIEAGWEKAVLEMIPGTPESGIPGSIGRFYGGTVMPLNSECTAFGFQPYGHQKPRAKFFNVVDGGFTPDPQAYAHDLASNLNRAIGKERSAVFETEDGSASYTVRTYGNALYTIEGTDYPLKAFKEIDDALNTIGYSLPFPAALNQVHPEAGEFFSPWGNQDEKPETVTLTIPSAGSSPRP